MAKDMSRSVHERKKWRSCASALKTRLALRCREEQEKCKPSELAFNPSNFD